MEVLIVTALLERRMINLVLIASTHDDNIISNRTILYFSMLWLKHPRSFGPNRLVYGRPHSTRSTTHAIISKGNAEEPPWKGVYGGLGYKGRKSGDYHLLPRHIAERMVSTVWTHWDTPLVNSASNSMSFPFASLSGLKSSVASIVATALQTEASAVHRPGKEKIPCV